MIEFFKTKFVATLLSFMFVVSVFSGVCLQDMDIDEGMAMVHTSVEQEHTTMDHPSVACKKVCEVTTYTAGKNNLILTRVISAKLLFLANTYSNLAVDNIYLSTSVPPPIQSKPHTVGSYQEGIKLLI